MSQLVQFEGQTHQFPDDFTSADIQRALSIAPRAVAVVPVPPLPPGFTIDRPAQAAIPPLPPGFKLDAPAAPAATKLSPVDFDPFAQPAEPQATSKLVPVDHDPFAAAPPNSLSLIETTPATATAPARAVMDTSGRANRPAALLPTSVGGAVRRHPVRRIFAGAIEPLFYFVDDGAVTLCDETGKTSGKTMRVGRETIPGALPQCSSEHRCRQAFSTGRSTIQTLEPRSGPPTSRFQNEGRRPPCIRSGPALSNGAANCRTRQEYVAQRRRATRKQF